MWQLLCRCSVTLLIALVCLPAASVAQLYGDYNPEDFQRDTPANIHFGFVKNGSGRYIEGATVILTSEKLDFVAVTDNLGRFRVALPIDILPNQVLASCSHPDYTSAKIIMRLPRGKATSPTELNCILS